MSTHAIESTLPAVVSLGQALQAGLTRGHLRQCVLDGRWRRLRYGVYLRLAAVPDGLPAPTAQDLLHLYQAAAEVLARGGATLSHTSSALAHGLPLATGTPRLVHIIAGPQQWTGSRNGVMAHLGTLPPTDVISVNVVRSFLLGRGVEPAVSMSAAPAIVPVTSPTRTVVDVARTAPLSDALAVGDAALARNLVSPEGLDAGLRRIGDAPGSRRAADAFEFLDPRRESPAESFSMAAFIEAGLPLPRVQVTISDDEGFVGRVDFLWEHLGVIGEVDGASKYTSPTVLLLQGQREARLRALGYVVVRWTWQELLDGTAIRRIRRALEAAAAA